MRVLVTGGAGFIGFHVCAQLVRAGHDVIALDALLPTVHAPGSAPVADGVRLVRADIRDADAWRSELTDVDVVCHQAAVVGLGVDMSDLPAYAGHNDLGTAVLLAEMTTAGVGRLVLASSMVIYGEGSYTCPEHGRVAAAPRCRGDLDAGRYEPPCPVCCGPLEPGLVPEDAPADPRNAYATSKLAQEHYARGWARETDGHAIALRYHNVYGPGMPRNTPYAGVASIFRSAVERGESPLVTEDGRQRRDFVHVSDVAAANVAAIDRVMDAAGQSWTAYNIGSGTPHTVGDLANALTGGTDLHPRVTGAYRLGDVRHITADSSRARSELDWRPAMTFEEGMRRFGSDPLREAVG